MEPFLFPAAANMEPCHLIYFTILAFQRANYSTYRVWFFVARYAHREFEGLKICTVKIQRQTGSYQTGSNIKFSSELVVAIHVLSNILFHYRQKYGGTCSVNMCLMRVWTGGWMKPPLH